MKRFIASFSFSAMRRKVRGGFALVLVLASLVLLSIVILAFFASVTTESVASKSYSVSLESRKLADEALNIVTGQINDATTQAANNNQAWISQPGLIRCFDTSGSMTTAYKLYSSAKMRDTSSSYNPLTSDIPPATWYQSPALYTDLNAPVYVLSPTGSVTINSSTYSAIYPIVDPTAAYDATTNPNGVHGFSVSGAPVDPGTTSPSNPLPMPTIWFYLLRDGTISPGTAGTGNTITVSGATPANPIVGRIAFWTDDDTCKVNINTAAGDLWTPDTMSGTLTNPGSYMDTPHVSSTYDKNLANYQPVQKEFQRYPGHPATTYLSAVFPFLTRTDIAAIAPRTRAGGSVGGTVASTTALTPLNPAPRLYASTDELAYATNYTAATPPSRTAVQNNTPASPSNLSLLTPALIAKANFFITAHSRAPDVNLFNRPRITIWPEAATAADSDGTTTILGARTTFDKTIAFCSTVGGKPFYFVRNNCSSSTEDYANYPRNKALYTYLQNLTGDSAISTFNASNIPGFGGNFKAKYGDDRDQILTEIFDYIRCTNLCDASQATVSKRYAIGPSTPAVINSCPAGTGQVVPIQIKATSVNTRGFGRMPTVHSPTILIYPYNYVPNSPLNPQNNGVTKSVRAVFLIESFTVSHGVMLLVPNLVYEVKGLDGLTLDGTPMGFPATAQVNYSTVSPDHDYGWGSLEGAANLWWPGPKTLGSNPTTQYTLYSSVIPLGTAGAGKAVKPEYAPNTNTGAFGSYMTLTCPGTITVNVYSRDKITNVISSTPIQTLNFTFPTTSSLPTPRPVTSVGSTLPASPTPPASYTPAETGARGNSATINLWQDTYPNPKLATQQVTLQENDPIRSVEPTTGDARLIAAMQTVPAAAFAPDRDYNVQTLFASDMRCGNGLTFGIGSWGKLAAGANYVYINPSTFYPAVPSFLNPATGTAGAQLLNMSYGIQGPGDWDTGMGGVADGPYINKPDEGESGPSAYYTYTEIPVTASLFSPNRQVPSPVIFGSLSTGVQHSLAGFTANDPTQIQPWQTLLFCPNPAAKALHPGLASPPDHLLLDLFTMPVVEPYPISDPLSTAGKINLNYQIVPFNYITRNTGMQAVLKSTRIMAIPTADGGIYKSGAGAANYRLQIDPDQTLVAFSNRFAANQPFVSASEICTMFLVPQGVTYIDDPTMAVWWDNYTLTGDNLREKPYADIYGRLTTKSNTYTVHVRAQSLQKIKGSTANQWTEGTDLVTSEYRGSYTLERFLDPNLSSYDESLPLTAYKFRVVDTKQFAP
jgi:uncharacterized protein (TIGR02600 family)